ncbi:hypothetical protein [Massilia sp. TSP1-1-2]|uniref:hypothetical protein n=1 Tax=Massilia sp. TSP1-1-2 TaxID=2804649 RepID=UPI003CF29FDA
MNQDQAIMRELQRQNRLLRQVVTVGGAMLAVGMLAAATSSSPRGKFSEIDVERINIVTPGGKTDLVISNRERIPQPVMGGKEIKRDGPARPGIIFYNAAGDESGGLIFDGKLDAEGHPVAGMHFSMDRFGGDQQLALGHYEQNGSMTSGLNIYDRGLVKDYDPLWKSYQGAAEGPAKEALLRRWKDAGGEQTRRLFVGKTPGKSSAVILADAQGRPKIMMTVTPEGQPSLDFMDADGKVTMHLPQPAPPAARSKIR